jgi:hypothetical protein
MSRSERWRTMGEDAWDEPYTPEDIAQFKRQGRPVPKRSPIPGVLIQTAAPLPIQQPKANP